MKKGNEATWMISNRNQNDNRKSSRPQQNNILRTALRKRSGPGLSFSLRKT